MFDNSVDALLHVVRNNGIKDVQTSISCMRNGILHCSVQVSCNDGTGYGIEAYGEEAEALFQEAKKHSKKEWLTIV